VDSIVKNKLSANPPFMGCRGSPDESPWRHGHHVFVATLRFSASLMTRWADLPCR